MAEGIYSTTGQDKIYARNRFGRKLLKTTSVVAINTHGEVPEGQFVKILNSGDNVVVSAVSGRIIEVTSYNLVASGACSLSFKSGTATTIFGPVSLAANGSITINDIGIKTAVGEGLSVVSTSQVGGSISYRII